MKTFDDDYKYISYEYIVSPGLKVGSAFERHNLGFADEEDIIEVKEFIRLVEEPLRKGLFQDCVIKDIFPMVRMEDEKEI